MEYVCLRFGCQETATAAGNCGNGHGALSPVKEWSEYSGSDTLVTVSNFHPSTRRVTFDVHVDHAQHKVYVVLWVNLVFEAGAGAAAWSSSAKADFKKYLRASAGLLDQKVHFRDGNGQIFMPYFFVEFPWFASNAHVTVNARTLPAEAMRALRNIANQLPPNNGVTFGTADYPRARPAPSRGNIHAGVTCLLSQPAVRNFDVDGSICNPFTHELGHLLGLPDEYDQFPPGGGLVPARAQENWDPKTKAILYWVKALQEYGVNVPAWGHFGNGHHQVNEHSLMRDVTVGAGCIKSRHYIPIYEGLVHASTMSQSLQGPFTLV